MKQTKVTMLKRRLETNGWTAHILKDNEPYQVILFH